MYTDESSQKNVCNLQYTYTIIHHDLVSQRLISISPLFQSPPIQPFQDPSSDRCHGGFLPNEVLPLHLLRGFLIFRLPFSLHEGLRWGGQGAGFGFEKPQGGGNRRADGGDVWTSSWLNCQWIWLKIFNSWAMNREFRNSGLTFGIYWIPLAPEVMVNFQHLRKMISSGKKTGRSRHVLHPRKTSQCIMIKQSAWHCFILLTIYTP